MKRILIFLLFTGCSIISTAKPLAGRAAPSIASFTPALGPVGTLVTITGTDLSGLTALSIGGKAAIAVSNTGSSLVAMVMAGAVTGSISVTTAAGTATSSSNFIITISPAPNVQQGSKLVGTGNAGTALQGTAVALSADGNTAVVGGYSDNNGMGAAWIFTRSGGTWSQQGNKLVGTGATGTYISQGRSVGISADGNTVILGGITDNANMGAAWIFVRNGTTWTQQGNKLVGTGNTGTAFQGYSVALSADGNTALVGGKSDNSGIGATWVFVRSGTTWSQQGNKLVGTGGIGNPNQGTSVSLSSDGNTAIVGGESDNSTKGAAWIFVRSGTSWSQQGSKLLGTGSSGNPHQGQTVSINADGNTAIVGGFGDNGGIGAAWVFVRSGTSWSQQGSKLTATDILSPGSLGYSVSLSADGNTAVVGGATDNSSEGAAWVYTRSGTTWTQQGNKRVGTGNVGTATQGMSVSLSADGNTFISGGNMDNSNMGATWVFRYLSDNADLSALALSSGTLLPAFNSGTTAYTASVGNTVGSITVTPVQAEANATVAVQVNGGGYTNVAAGNASGPLALNVGSNTIDVKVTAADGTTVKIYTVTVTRRETQTITFTALSNSTYGDDPFNLPAYGGASGNPLTFTSSNTTVATISNGTVTILAAGTTTITASQAGNANYDAAADVIRTLVVNKKSITVTANAQSKTYGDADPALTYTFTPALVAGDAFTGTLSRAAGENIGAYAINQNTLALSGNYILNYTGADLTIGTKTITVTANAQSKTYGDADPVLTYTFTPALVTGDAFTGTLGRAAGENAGLYTIIKNTLTLNSNYVLNYTGANLTIGKKTITVTADDQRKGYGDADPVLTYTFTPALVTGDAFTGTLKRMAGENIGTYNIKQYSLALNSNYILDYYDADLTITRRIIAVTADAKSKTYGDADPALTYTFTPSLLAGDGFAGTLSRTAGESVGSYTIDQNTLSLNSNYTLIYTTDLLTIGAKAITVTAGAKSKTYGDTDPALTYTFTPALVTGDAFTGTLSRAAGENFGTYAINQSTLALSSNYDLNYISADLTIGKKTVAVTANAQNKTYGDADPAFTYTVAPALITGDAFTGTLSRTAGEGVGTYAINQNTLSLNNNYILNYTSADLTIGEKTVVVTANAQSKTYGDADPVFTYTVAPALVTGDGFTGALSRTAGESIGTYAINQNSLSLNSNYVLNYASADLTIGKKTVVVTADAQNKTYGDTDPALTYTFAPALITGDAFTGILSRTVGESIGTYSINRNTLSLNSNYVLSYTGADLTIGAKVITVTANAQNKTYGDTDPALTYTFTPALITGDAFAGTLSRTAGENVGTYSINQNTLSLGQNYILNYTAADLTIKKKSLTISADDKNKVFGTANPILSATYTGFTGTDNETVLNTPVVLTTTADINSPVGTYPIRAGGATSQNYDISFVDGTLTITSSNQHIDFEALEDKLSTDGTFTLTATATSGLPVIYTSSNSAIARIVNGNQVEILQAGTVIITASQDGNVNYTAATPVSQQLTILDNPLPVIVIESNKGNSISKGETVLLTAGGANTYQWLAANGIVSGENTSVLTVRPSVTTTYTVTGSNQYGRSSTQTFTLEVKDDLEAVGATNILTPNGDGINDYWIVRNIDMFPNNEVKIFDRSGRLVYTKKGYTNNWGATVNGSPLAEGTYYYIIDFGNGAGIKKGFITVIRR
ncbi:MBG domain-containing protein [Chitinophaga tropicalis]|nr:MBG domain-containing protein [Chitinophaga tropicalis]